MPNTHRTHDLDREVQVPTDRLLYKPSEAARLLSFGRSKIYELMASGDLEYTQIGRARRIPADALRAFIKAHRVAA